MDQNDLTKTVAYLTDCHVVCMWRSIETKVQAHNTILQTVTLTAINLPVGTAALQRIRVSAQLGIYGVPGLP